MKEVKKLKKEYVTPSMEITKFASEDILTTSGDVQEADED